MLSPSADVGSSPHPRSALCGCGLFSSPGPASHVSHMQPQTRSRLCPGLTPLPEEERAEEGCHQVPASSQKYICPSPAVCDLALLSRALSEDRCPPAPAPSDVLTLWEDVNG